VGGLGLVGTGRGGGGTGEGTIGLGTLGRSEGRRRGQWCWLWPGCWPAERASRTSAPCCCRRAEVRGSLDKEIIRRIIRRHINEVKYCYQVELQANPNLYGRVVVQFTIAATGQVVVSQVQSSTLSNPRSRAALPRLSVGGCSRSPRARHRHRLLSFVLRSAGAEEGE